MHKLTSSKLKLFLFFSFLCTLSLSCAPNKVEDLIGKEWNSMNETIWYKMEGNGNALERWKFYKDSIVVDIDHFHRFRTNITDSMQVYMRERHVGKVCTKDVKIDYNLDRKVKTYLCSELQWKRMAPGTIDIMSWTYVYDWSVYQMWCIEYSLEGLACVGDAPNCYEITKVRPVKLKYVKDWLYDKL